VVERRDEQPDGDPGGPGGGWIVGAIGRLELPEPADRVLGMAAPMCELLRRQ
jgi:hypothetical protein